VVLCGFARVMRGVRLMAVRHLRVVRRLFVVARFVMFGGGVVMLGGVRVVLRSFAVMLRGMLRHSEISFAMWMAWVALGLSFRLTDDCDGATSQWMDIP
jgi:hypothetical protein